MRKAMFLAAAVVAVLLAGCADSEVIVVSPERGLVGIDAREAAPATAPLLTVTYFDNVQGRNVTAVIYGYQPSSGDVAYDPFRDVFTATAGPDVLFFGFDASDPNRSEFRAFLDFPLNGSTGQDVVPSGADVVSATLRVTVTEVSFASVVPSFVDLVEYPLSGPTAAQFDSAPLAFRTLDIFDTDAGATLYVEVTSLMREAQRLDLSDFQARFTAR